MKLDLFKLPLLKGEISLPEKIDELLAEETGAHIGDGTMNFYKNRDKLKGSYALRGHLIDDKPYYPKLYDLNPSLRDMPSTGVHGFQKWSDDLVNFKHKILGLPLGRKLNIQIPSLFLTKEDHIRSVIRGIFDTDGMLYLQPKYGGLYPRIEIGTTSPPLALQLNSLLKELNMRSTCYLSKRENKPTWLPLYRISVRGVPMMHKWFDLIEPHNPKHLSKYQYYHDHS